MAFGSLLKSLFGGKPSPVISGDPFGSKVLPSAVPPPPTPAKVTPAISVHREEIIGAGSRLAGYRFSARRAGSDAPPPAEAKVAALKLDNLAAFAQRRIALVPIAISDWGAADFKQFTAPYLTLHVLASADAVDLGLLVPVLTEIHAAGIRVAVDATIATKHPDILPLLSTIVIDYSAYTLEGFQKQVAEFTTRHADIDLIAEHIGSWPEHRMALAGGVRYALGGYASVPDEEIKQDGLNQSRLVLIEMLNLLRKDADIDELEGVAKRDPGVALKLVEMANSPISGLSNPVSSLHQAFMVVGREAIYRWLSLGIYRTGGSVRDETILELALRRARFLELVGQQLLSKKECDELFLVGMLSLLDSLLGMPLAKVLERMTLPAGVTDVLLRSEGSYGRFLRLALAVEKGRSVQIEQLASELGVAAEALNDCSREAFAWAEDALKLS